MGGGVALLARGIWWRRWASVVLVLCASITVAGAATGPLWGRASQASLLARTLEKAKVSERAWIVTSSTEAYSGLSDPRPDAARVDTDVRYDGQLPPELGRWFDRTTEQISTANKLQVTPVRPGSPAGAGAPAASKPPQATLTTREGFCAHVELVSGRCPAGRTDLLLSDRSAKALGVGPGDQVRFPELDGTPDGAAGAFTVAGVYRATTVPTSSRFWMDSPDFTFTPAARLLGQTFAAQLDPVLVQPAFLMSARTVAVKIQLERVLRPDAITLDNADQVTRQLREQGQEVAATSEVAVASAAAARTLAESVHGRDLVAGTATFVGLQIVVFGWVVLFGLVAVSVAARDAEMALAKLRGLRGRRLAAHALTEPVVLVLAAVPIGLAAAWLAVAALAREVLFPGTPVTAPAAVWWVVGATVAGSVLACVLATRRSLRMRVADQLRRQTTRAGTAGPIVTAVLLTLAAVGLLLVLTLGRNAESALPALLTPVVVGLAAGLLTGYAVQLLLRAGVGRTRRWSLGPYLAVRQLARQASLTQVTALVTVATAVSGFAAGAYVVTADQRESQARLDVGAQRVVHVAPAPALTLIGATRQVDPRGRWAMAAIQHGTGPAMLLAVDSSRYQAAFEIDRGSLARPRALGELVPRGLQPPLVVHGRSASITVSSSRRLDLDIKLDLQLRVVKPDGEVEAISLGSLDRLSGGHRTFTGPAPECVDGCTVAKVLVNRSEAEIGEISGQIDLVSLRVGGRTYPFSTDEWRTTQSDETMPDSFPTSSIGPVVGPAGGLSMSYDANASALPGIVRRDIPSELPAIIGDRTPLEPIGTRRLVYGSTLAQGTLPFSVAGRSPVLPRSEGGAIVDLDLVTRVASPDAPDLDYQVWLGPAAPADSPARLTAAGLRVVRVESRAARRSELDRAEPARAQLFLLGAGGAVLLAGVAGIATILTAAARRRSVESAALHAMAVPSRVVRGSAVLENVLLILPGVVIGAGCAAALVRALTSILAEVTGAGAAVSGPPAIADVVLPVLAGAVVTTLLLVPVVLVVTRPAGDETSMRVAT
jgi:putative ABC transport system permease protein